MYVELLVAYYIVAVELQYEYDSVACFLCL